MINLSPIMACLLLHFSIELVPDKSMITFIQDRPPCIASARETELVGFAVSDLWSGKRRMPMAVANPLVDVEAYLTAVMLRQILGLARHMVQILVVR